MAKQSKESDASSEFENDELSTDSDDGDESEGTENTHYANEILDLLGEDANAWVKKELKIISNQLLETIINKLFATLSTPKPATKVTKIKKVREYLLATVSERKYVLQQRIVLVQLYKERNINYVGSRNNLIKRLVEADNTGSTFENNNESPASLSVLGQIIKQSFLKAQTNASDKIAAKKGHEMEPKHLKAFFELSQSGNTGSLQIQSMYYPGMIQKESLKCAKSTVDGLALATIDYDDTVKRIPVEVKTRVSIGMIDKAKEIQDILRSLKGPGASTFGFVFAEFVNEKDFYKYIHYDSECIQILHHAFAYSSEHAILLVGNCSGLLYAVHVQFSESLLESYEKIMKYLY